MPRIDVEAFEDEWEDDHSFVEPRRRSDALSETAKQKVATHEIARVVAVDRGRIMVVFDGELLPARFAGGMRGTKVVVGDEVRITPPRDDNDVARITELLDRRTWLTRTGDDAQDDERVVVANADQVVVVLTADHLEVGARFADRVLVAASVGHLDAVLCINKLDLIDDRGEFDEVAARYEALGVPVRGTSAVTGEGLDELRMLLTGVWSAFSGHSGVGKSSLFNLLVPDADHAVGEIGRFGGRHTTVASKAVPIPAIDAWLVDTPGVRSFGLGTLAAEHLTRHMPELDRLECALDDCVHDGEPGCALPDALAAGDVHPTRLETYRRLLAALRDND
ncbi:ribosome small subunit-dependent GTPase A [Nitriliruptor alkaliphilus]|uniref:ribosome small subunit-dependent GTPase A n=1 Tax=Nitriliruptor alkaliphilus TaxID=427918 RepID=UPI000696BA1F|nr:ribosome small subunit-dependent GTPase A [Nitriliruptor alkaliphilus]